MKNSVAEAKIAQKMKYSRFIYPVTIVLLLLALFYQHRDAKYHLFYNYQSIPDIDLSFDLSETNGVYQGNITGFVRFDEISKQPTDLKQYYVIVPYSTFFILDEIIKLPPLPPTKTGSSRLEIIDEGETSITLKDESGNTYIIDKKRKEVVIYDSDSDKSSLITTQSDYSDYIRILLKL